MSFLLDCVASLNGVALLDVDEGRLVFAGGVERAAPAEAFVGVGAQDLKDPDARFEQVAQ